jgi:hypothetical protein
MYGNEAAIYTKERLSVTKSGYLYRTKDAAICNKEAAICKKEAAIFTKGRLSVTNRRLSVPKSG